MNAFTRKAHSVLHFFHRPFSRFISQQQFRYLACGSFMAFLDILMFFVCYNFILHRQTVFIGTYAILPHVAAMWIPFPIGFIISFLLSRYVVFNNTSLKRTTSLFRYILLVILCQILNLVLIKFFVETCHFYPTFAKITCTVSIAVFSYISQRYFTFKVKEILPS